MSVLISLYLEQSNSGTNRTTYVMECVSLPPLSNFAICGGTHGNELTGVYILREMQKHNVEKVGSVSITTVLSNPRAVDACRRYTDRDLNRCFTDDLLSSPITESTPYELRRAQELNAHLGPKGSEEAVDLLCDMHNTTSNMGLCIIFNSADWLILHICKYLQSKITSMPVRALQMDLPLSEAFSVDSLGKHGFSFEIGPQPHGVLRADVFNTMKEAVDLTIEWLQQFNSGRTFEGGEVEAYTRWKTVHYPRDPTTDEITAAIHPQLQDNDFKLLQPGDPIFLSLSGETVKHEGDALYPVFVNECAYYEQKIAYHLTQKSTLTLPSINVKKD
ncbi:N-acyl-aromatic-L-amino acid amidohydrolase (carboxylate-forming) B isoform X1 [Scophthalmus maximus]|uniref:N-acyl-aromatic-L-amino acid amidohydrolase n=1 Tax=Scophthalmus maximus TaxID=52904 RepID=A0A8D3E8V6_SCOMX|nr:N-acyl-aromatic-L-amino acid amidohydrolase (carboxylate-forming) B isoform X1 [Scophthalmus maximus]